MAAQGTMLGGREYSKEGKVESLRNEDMLEDCQSCQVKALDKVVGQWFQVYSKVGYMTDGVMCLES